MNTLFHSVSVIFILILSYSNVRATDWYDCDIDKLDPRIHEVRSLLKQGQTSHSQPILLDIIRDHKSEARDHAIVRTYSYYFLGMAKFHDKEDKSAIDYFKKFLEDSHKLNGVSIKKTPLKIPMVIVSYVGMHDAFINLDNVAEAKKCLDDLDRILNQERAVLVSKNTFSVEEERLASCIDSKLPIVEWLIANPAKLSTDYNYSEYKYKRITSSQDERASASLKRK
jgi:hypothetical protein